MFQKYEVIPLRRYAPVALLNDFSDYNPPYNLIQTTCLLHINISINKALRAHC